MRNPEGQRGSALLIAAVLVMALGLIIGGAMALRSAGGERAHLRATQDNMAKLAKSVVGFAVAMGRLPCPADPNPAVAANNGREARDGAGNCTVPDGILPWITLGLAEHVSLDTWSNRISYRVDDELVRDDLAGGGILRSTSFGTGYGLSVCNDAACSDLLYDRNEPNSGGTPFVLISHGPTGGGAWLPSGAQRANPTGVQELDNLKHPIAAGHTYYRLPETPPSPTLTPNQFFDDIVVPADLTVAALSARLRPPGQAPYDVSFTPENTSDMTSPWDPASGQPPHFITTIPGKEGCKDCDDAAAGTVDGKIVVDMGNDAGTYRTCLWWPAPLDLNRPDKKSTIRMFVEFAVQTPKKPKDPMTGGFIYGLLPWHGYEGGNLVQTEISPAICGAKHDEDMGWDNGTNENLPSPRFGVELDLKDDMNGDPPENHLSAVYTGTEHVPLLASMCWLPGDEGCNVGPTETWLESGLATFHKMRVDIDPAGTSSCGSLARLRAWVWEAGKACATCTGFDDVSKAFDTTDANVARIETCLHQIGPKAWNLAFPPSPLDAYDQLYFGFTTSVQGGGQAGVNLRFRDLRLANRPVN